MDWNLLKWFVKLNTKNKIAVGVAMIILSLWGAYTKQGHQAIKEKDEYRQQLQACNQDKVNITERLKDQVIKLQQENQDYERKELERLRSQNEYRDSVNTMYLLTRRKAEKIMENAKK